MNLWTDKLSLYLDDELAAEDRAELEARLREDESLRTILIQLRELRRLAGELPDRPPEADLWPGIQSRISGVSLAADSPKAPSDDSVARDAAGDDSAGIVPMRGRESAKHRRLTFTMPQLAAASVALVLFGSSLSWLVRNSLAPGAEGAGNQAPGLVADGGPLLGGDGGPLLVGDRESAAAKYDAAIRDLETRLAAGRSSLDTVTVRVLATSLAKIDLAIEEARAALSADPANEYLNRHLTSAMSRKLEVLQGANQLVSAQT